ncbi:MAG: hypothetical protein PVH61_42710, partial [Candidatus Aminicenantes bacterium]
MSNQNVSQVLKRLLTVVFVCRQKKARVVRGGSLFDVKERNSFGSSSQKINLSDFMPMALASAKNFGL